MYRSAAPKLSLSISAAQNVRPTLSLKSPGLPRTPISPSAASPTAKRFSSLQVPSYNYSNSCTSKSILKKQPNGHNAVPEKRIQFKGTPTVHCVTPIENPEEYYGNYVKLSREERRWMVQSDRRRYSITDCAAVQSDDTSVAIVEKNTQKSSAQIHFLENVTADLNAYRGVHPILALESHQESLAKLVNKALSHLPVASGDTTTAHGTISLTNCSQPRRKPDFISVTRGPGMRANLFVGLDTGKALSVAWQIPFVGVHHMQAHLLTPRLVSALSHNQDNTPTTTPSPITPEFPFLSILVSGGHSILVKSASITEHEVMASSADIAIGESLDKSAREILPDDLLANAKNTMYGKILEQFAFRNGPIDYADYQPPKKRGDEVVKRETPWGWSLTTPFANTRHLQFSFSSIASAVTKIVAQKQKAGETLSHDERVDVARESMRVCFEHLASRTVIALEALRAQPESQEIKTLVVSGGVAANRFLMTVLRSFLDVRGFGHVDIVAPPPYLCTDNAAMIGWAGIEMFEAGWRTDLGIRALRKWSLDPQADDGGVLGPNGWQRV
ncbi:conserved hypothetical protein [Aspergillus terreus NIH2624]|uniref:N(6)-L-threonylcarbamoyladenine synthase n=1 Tax=Aspergillus terreus (strain NIH 2624 / FGSC A1156) TaxID=341663 RepID=Q0CIN6_ASPTN|nr:uncharacterized protein ATEG_06448 [Aspergillus terreus NIH2624]EAU32992.1 conserved hypothetical protein [Aspergillus terreus NIH2624]